jgi:phosphoribosylamine--glycine ligase
MRVLVVGSGGREHALSWKLASDPSVSKVVCAPGNPGIGEVASIGAVDVTDFDALAALARRERIDLTVVGPEVPLGAGLADRFDREGLLLFGPTRAAARLETSKAFAKAFMARHRVPTARYRTCKAEREAERAADEFGYPVVLKTDGLAAGKGVVVAADAAEAREAISSAMIERRFGDAGSTLVVEEFLSGEEASFFCVCDGVRALPLGTAQDHKRVNDDDRGPNTGGMGAFSPSPMVTPAVRERVMREIVEPVLDAMRGESVPYRGFLYVGLMLTTAGPKVVEFNVRFGDPEAQVVLPGVEGDLAPMLAEAACGRLTRVSCGVSAEPCVGVVMASGGYPGPFAKGKAIRGLAEAAAMERVLVFQAGTTMCNGELVTDGGRVLTVVGRGSDYRESTERAYAAVSRISFDDMHIRRDIGRKAFGRSAAGAPR